MKKFVLLLIVPFLGFGQGWEKKDVTKFLKECKTDLASLYADYEQREERCNCLLKAYEKQFQSVDELEKLFMDFNMAQKEGREKDAKSIQKELEIFIKDALGNCEIKY
tara:strand:- start:662 stop:985 length:324 start_codon:yes stop_codon:yes gene_type:complete